MLTERGRRISGFNGSFEFSNRKFRGYGFVDRSQGFHERSPSRSCSVSKILRITPPTSSPPSSASTCAGYIEHRVSKFDTLAGIAIKYGVEVCIIIYECICFGCWISFFSLCSQKVLFQVADITKLNGLVTDLQMFALESLRIPLPGRHPPSPCLSNGSLNHGYF